LNLKIEYEYKYKYINKKHIRFQSSVNDCSGIGFISRDFSKAVSNSCQTFFEKASISACVNEPSFVNCFEYVSYKITNNKLK